MKYIFGHKNPDTDSFCSAVVYANFLRACGEDAEAIVLGAPNKETEYVFGSLGIEYPRQTETLPEGSDVILVDHNEASQSIDGREQLHVVGVIDHHKVADFVTSGPLMMRVDPVGCTCTILHEMFLQHKYTPSKIDAALMASAIISDTLYFRSPTTTQRDKDAIAVLSSIAGIEDVEAYSMAMFSAKSDLGDMPAQNIVTMDYKTFNFAGTLMGIGVLETTNPGYALGRKEELIEAIQQVKSQEGLSYLLLCVVDVLNEHTTALIASKNEQELVYNVFGSSTVEGHADLGARISRKKQIAPDIDQWFTRNAS